MAPFMFGRFETLLNATKPPERPEPPGGLLAFYWHFAGQAKWLFISLMMIELCQALLDAVIPWFFGRIVTLANTVARDQYLTQGWHVLAGLALILLLVRPAVVFVRYLVVNQAISGQFTNLIRWQSHWHVARQSWAFFQNDFAGRIANRVMQTGGALRQTVVSGITALWYVIVYGSTAVALAASADIWLTVPILLWFAGYIGLLFYFVPRMRDRSKKSSEARSAVMGRIVDSYTNILTVKLFARARDEDDYVRDSIDTHTRTFLWSQRLMTTFGTLLSLINGLLIAGSVGLAVTLWQMETSRLLGPGGRTMGFGM